MTQASFHPTGTSFHAFSFLRGFIYIYLHLRNTLITAIHYITGDTGLTSDGFSRERSGC